MADGTLFGLVHDLQDRRRARKIREARRNYLADPLAAIQAVHEIDPDTGLALRDDYQNVIMQRQAGQQAAEQAERERALGAARNLTQGLIRVRDNGGDVGAAFNESLPILRNGFGMTDDEIDNWRVRITGDPAALDNMYRMLNEPTEAESKLYQIGPGESLATSRGEILARSPALPKTIKLPNAQGGEDLYIMDENGNFVQSAGVPPVGSAASVPGSKLAVDPEARGMRNMNPGNIKDGPWARSQPGYAGSDGTFARFDSLEAGQAAQERLLQQHYVNGKRSVSDIVLKYLGGANNPENSAESQRNYIGYVAGQLGIDPNDPVPPAMLPQLSQAMREFENGSVNAPRPAVSTSGEPPEPNGWRMLSEEEVQSLGLDPKVRYQIGIGGDNEGSIKPIAGQTQTKRTPGTLTLPAHSAAVREVQRLRDEARGIVTHPAFEQATGSVQGLLPSVFQETRNFDDKLQSFRDQVVIRTIKAMKEASATGATGFGQLTEKEGSRLENSMGSLRQTSPENLRDTLSELERDAMITIGTLYNIPPEATMMLLQNPNLAGKFDEKYGEGMSRRIMGIR